MIAYFDTSALIPLIIEEPGSARAAAVWDAAERAVTVRLAYPEGRAALAQARRLERLTTRGYGSALSAFEGVWAQLDRVEVTAALAQRAGDFAEQLPLRGYDAVHLAAAATLAPGPDLVVVAGDTDLINAAHDIGLATAHI